MSTRIIPRRGPAQRDGGRATIAPTPRVHRAASTQLAGLYPFLYGRALPPVGPYLGIDTLSGAAFSCHPVEWLRLGLVSNPNLLVTGVPGLRQVRDAQDPRAAADDLRRQDVRHGRPEERVRHARAHRRRRADRTRTRSAHPHQPPRRRAPRREPPDQHGRRDRPARRDPPTSAHPARSHHRNPPAPRADPDRGERPFRSRPQSHRRLHRAEQVDQPDDPRDLGPAQGPRPRPRQGPACSRGLHDRGARNGPPGRRRPRHHGHRQYLRACSMGRPRSASTSTRRSNPSTSPASNHAATRRSR
jgi:hypothetical protein